MGKIAVCVNPDCAGQYPVGAEKIKVNRHKEEKVMKRTVIEAAVQQLDPVDPAEPAGLVPLGALAAEGLGWGEHTRTPKDAVDTLARRLGELVVLDDIGRRCVSRDTARALFAERAEADERLRQRRHALQERARRRPRPPAGVPALDAEATAFQTMVAHAGEDEKKRDAAGERWAALLRGESTGALIGPRPSRERGK